MATNREEYQALKDWLESHQYADYLTILRDVQTMDDLDEIERLYNVICEWAGDMYDSAPEVALTDDGGMATTFEKFLTDLGNIYIKETLPRDFEQHAFDLRSEGEMYEDYDDEDLPHRDFEETPEESDMRVAEMVITYMVQEIEDHINPYVIKPLERHLAAIVKQVTRRYS